MRRAEYRQVRGEGNSHGRAWLGQVGLGSNRVEPCRLVVITIVLFPFSERLKPTARPRRFGNFGKDVRSQSALPCPAFK